MRLFVLAFILGAFLLQDQRSLPGPDGALLGSAAALACALVPNERRLARAFLLTAAGFLLGFGYSAERAQVRLAESLPFAMEGVDVAVTGIVSGLPQPNDMGTRFLFDVEEWGVPAAASATLPSTISLAWYAQGDEAMPRVVACERWRFAARLKRPRGFANPHGFDFEAWALERGIRATGYVRGTVEARRVSERVAGWPCLLPRRRI